MSSLHKSLCPVKLGETDIKQSPTIVEPPPSHVETLMYWNWRQNHYLVFSTKSNLESQSSVKIVTQYTQEYILLTVSKIYLMENKGAETELTVKPEVDLVACNEPHSGQLSLHWRQCGGERRELWGLWLNKETDTESDQKINPRGDESKVLIARDPFSLRVTGGNKMFPLLEEEVRRRWGGGEEEVRRRNISAPRHVFPPLTEVS